MVIPSKTFGTSSSKYTRDGNSDTPNSSATWKSCKNTVLTLIHSTILYGFIKVRIKLKVNVKANVKVKVKVKVKLPLWVHVKNVVVQVCYK
jgi:Ca2+-dependent lipid-binding protein, contains C2 domain